MTQQHVCSPTRPERSGDSCSVFETEALYQYICEGSARCLNVLIGSKEPRKCVKMRATVARALRDLASHMNAQLVQECLHISVAIPVPSNARLIWNEAGRADAVVQDHFYDSTVEKVCVLLARHF